MQTTLYTIYKTTNTLNGKTYIGKHQTTNLDDGYIGSGKYLLNAVNKHGAENFTKEILFVFDNEAEMNAKEAELVTADFVLLESNYNLCVGGHGGFGYINSTLTDSQKRKRAVAGGLATHAKHGAIGIAAAHKRMQELLQADPDYIKRTNVKPFLGKSHTAESKNKMRESSKGQSVGKLNSQYGKIWIFSDTEKRSIKIDRHSDIPEGWTKGRRIKFN
jgi:hypothetical protein